MPQLQIQASARALTTSLGVAAGSYNPVKVNNEVVSVAESVPDQVGDVLRAKHAGSRVVLPTGSAALCHLPSWLMCAH